MKHRTSFMYECEPLHCESQSVFPDWGQVYATSWQPYNKCLQRTLKRISTLYVSHVDAKVECCDLDRGCVPIQSKYWIRIGYFVSWIWGVIEYIINDTRAVNSGKSSYIFWKQRTRNKIIISKFIFYKKNTTPGIKIQVGQTKAFNLKVRSVFT